MVVELIFGIGKAPFLVVNNIQRLIAVFFYVNYHLTNGWMDE